MIIFQGDCEMARISRKTPNGTMPVAPERIYRAAAYARLSVEDNNRSGDRESITMQQYMMETYIANQPDMVFCGVYSDV